MPTLIVEDGSIVDDANTYASLANLTTFATNRGFALPTQQADKETLLLKAMDYLESRDYVGHKVSVEQSLQWPRQGVVIDGFDFEEDAIPKHLINAQCQLVVEQFAGVSLYPTPNQSSTTGFVTQETIGPLTTRYSEQGIGSISNSRAVVIASVEVFLKAITGCRVLETKRI